MTWQFCDNHHCPDSWHWTDLDHIAVACSYAREQVEPESPGADCSPVENLLLSKQGRMTGRLTGQGRHQRTRAPNAQPRGTSP